MRKAESSPYINKQRRDYALYVMTSRAIPAITDGLKSGGRRVLWTARNGKHWKTANLAGSTMPIHPHASPDGSINTLTARYGNNIPLFTGHGAFGTLLEPGEFGASRYTAIETSKFTQDVVLRDIEIIPMMDNYDGTEVEPVHFLPLVPIALLNPAEGIAIGFATNILPRELSDIIAAQLNFLNGSKMVSELIPNFLPLNNKSHLSVNTDRGTAYYFNGEYTIVNATTIIVTKLPYGQSHPKVIAKICGEEDNGNIVDWTDDSKDTIKIEVKFKKGYLRDLTQDQTLNLLGLSVRHIENLNVLDFTGEAIWNPTPIDLVQKYTKWRLGWYVNRYTRLRDLLLVDLQKYLDIRCAIKNNVAGMAKKTQSRSELKEYLTEIGIVNIDYIADLPIYRFTEDERLKNEERLKEAEVMLEYYNGLLASDDKRKQIYITELQEVLTKYNKGYYK
jgi:DNA gyrase/topoisomerase IV subunit A